LSRLAALFESEHGCYARREITHFGLFSSLALMCSSAQADAPVEAKGSSEG